MGVNAFYGTVTGKGRGSKVISMLFSVIAAAVASEGTFCMMRKDSVHFVKDADPKLHMFASMVSVDLF